VPGEPAALTPATDSPSWVTEKEDAMQWLNEPASWSHDSGVLRVKADAGTDFWRTTGYGYVRDNGHFYFGPAACEFDLSMRLVGAYSAQYDQAGAMVRLDERNWVKTGVEFFEGRLRLSTVVTFENSSWVVSELAPATKELTLSLKRRGDALEVHYRADGGPLELAALVHLAQGAPALAGPMCAAPEGAGFEVSFYDLTFAAV
jgi:regulation of enolase protein 1 (concanavalin A-like superfamily)